MNKDLAKRAQLLKEHSSKEESKARASDLLEGRFARMFTDPGTHSFSWLYLFLKLIRIFLTLSRL